MFDEYDNTIKLPNLIGLPWINAKELCKELGITVQEYTPLTCDFLQDRIVVELDSDDIVIRQCVG